MLPADDRRDCRRRCRGNDRGGAIAARPGQAGRRPAGDPDGHAVARAGCWCREGITTTHSRGAARPNGWTGLASRDAARIDWHAGWDLCLFSRAAAGWQQVIPPVCLLAGPCAGSATASPAAPAPSWLAPGQVPRADRTRSRTRPQPAIAPAPARARSPVMPQQPPGKDLGRADQQEQHEQGHSGLDPDVLKGPCAVGGEAQEGPHITAIGEVPDRVAAGQDRPIRRAVCSSRSSVRVGWYDSAR